jgi:nickel/cobalt transporter (NicO) family protein
MRGFRLLAILSAASGLAWAHPLGNLSVSHYARLEPFAKGVEVTYALDLAEIPTFELMQSWGVAKETPKDVLQTRAVEQARAWVENLVFTENGKPLSPKFESAELAILDGAGGLPVFRITTKLQLGAIGGRLEYEDRNYSARAGWREIVIRPGAGADVSKASNGDTDLSQALTAYPQDPGQDPPRNTRAWCEWRVAAGPVTQARKPVIEALTESAPPVPAPGARDARPSEAVSTGAVKRKDAISTILRMKDIPWPLMATLLGLAFWFGALHALEPGHGKTMVAAYLVGARGTPKHAMLLGGMVTFTHTISVFILGLGTMFLSRYFMPDRISKILGIVSGLTIIWIGVLLLWRRARSLWGHAHEHEHGHPHEHGHSHDHGHAHDHEHGHAHDHAHIHDDGHEHPHEHSPAEHSHKHGAFTHTHDGHTHTHVPDGEISMGSLIALGASGGLVPCPSALILLLSAISLGHVGLGMILLVAFSLGLAIVLMATGMAVLYAKNLIPDRHGRRGSFFRYMPVVSAAAIVVIGVIMTSVTLGWIPAMRFFG